jgi:hypothetical protein
MTHFTLGNLKIELHKSPCTFFNDIAFEMIFYHFCIKVIKQKMSLIFLGVKVFIEIPI